MTHSDLTGKLKVGDKVLEIFRQYSDDHLRVGTVEKLTATRAKVRFNKSKDEEGYTKEYVLKTAVPYPRVDSYSSTHIELFTDANKDRWNQYAERKRLEYAIFKHREVVEKGYADLKKLTLTQLRALETSFSDVARLVAEARK